MEDFSAIAGEFTEHLGDVFRDASAVALHDAYVHLAYLHLVAVTMDAFAGTMRLDTLAGGRLTTADFQDR